MFLQTIIRSTGQKLFDQGSNSVLMLTHNHVSRAGNKYADVITDLASRSMHILVSKDRTSDELIANLKQLFVQHPDWFINRKPDDDRFFRAGRFARRDRLSIGLLWGASFSNAIVR